MKVVISILLLLMVLTARGYACSCVVRTHERDFREARAVFIGRVLEIGPNDTGDEETRRFAPFRITLAVEKRWKGPLGEITIVSANGGPACGGFEFVKNERYLIYAFGRELEAGTACTRSRPLSRVDEDSKREMAQLGSVWFRLKSKVWRL
jgi:hypothetical protein